MCNGNCVGSKSDRLTAILTALANNPTFIQSIERTCGHTASSITMKLPEQLVLALKKVESHWESSNE